MNKARTRRPNDYMYAKEDASLNAIIWIERNKSYVVGWSMEFGCIWRVQARSACEEEKEMLLNK